MSKSKTGIELIADERREQIEKHGRTIASDKILNRRRQLRSAALKLISDEAIFMTAPDGWDKKIWARMAKKNVRQRLIIAGALIAAELDRLNDESD